jgi:hypothetical protein
MGGRTAIGYLVAAGNMLFFLCELRRLQLEMKRKPASFWALGKLEERVNKKGGLLPTHTSHLL